MSTTNAHDFDAFAMELIGRATQATNDLRMLGAQTGIDFSVADVVDAAERALLADCVGEFRAVPDPDERAVRDLIRMIVENYLNYLDTGR